MIVDYILAKECKNEEAMSDWQIREKCRECGAYVGNATPLGGDAE